MSFVSLGGDGSTRPTFFEMVAADRLMASLKAATMYSLSVNPSSPTPSPLTHRLTRMHCALSESSMLTIPAPRCRNVDALSCRCWPLRTLSKCSLCYRSHTLPVRRCWPSGGRAWRGTCASRTS